MPQVLERANAGTTYKFIDSDTHLTEPMDLWTSRAPARYRDRVPQVKMHEGRRSWVIDGDKVISLGAHPMSAMLKDLTKVREIGAFHALTYDDVHLGSFDIKERLAFMDDHGVWAQVVYPNILGFGGQRAAKVDPELRLVCSQIFNDAMAEFQEQSGGRICPMAMLPWWDADQAAAETRRIIDLGLKGVNINSAPQGHAGNDGGKLPDLGDPYWDPLWDVCQEARLPVNFHIGSSEQSVDWMGTQGWPGLSNGLRNGIGGAMLFFGNAQTLGNLIYSGLLDRYAGLQFVSVESGIGWIPFLLEALDYQYKEIAGSAGLKRLPSDYFATNFHGSFWFESKFICDSVRQVGIDNCMFQTDFPHPTSLYPIGDIDARLSALTPDERYKVMWGNAAALYRIDGPR